MKWLKTTLLKLLKDLVADLVEGALKVAIIKLSAKVDDSFDSQEQRDAIKIGINMLYSEVLPEIQERLEKL